MSNHRVIKRKNGLHVLECNQDGEYKDKCICHLCKKGHDKTPMSMCITLAKLWAISAEHKVVISISECMNYETKGESTV